MIEEFLKVNTDVMVGKDRLSEAARRAIALGAALQLTEAALGRDPSYGRYLVEHLHETVQGIEDLLDLREKKEG